MDEKNFELPKKRARGPRRKPLRLEMKIQLCQLVKEREVLWKKNHPRYKKNEERIIAWDEIGEIMDLPVKDIKGYWCAFREQLRYKCGKTKKTFKGDSDEDPEEEDDTNDIDYDEAKLAEWELWDHYKFVVCDNKLKPCRSSSLPTRMNTLEEDGNIGQNRITPYLSLEYSSESSTNLDEQMPSPQSDELHHQILNLPKEKVNKNSVHTRGKKYDFNNETIKQQKMNTASSSPAFLHHGLVFLESQLQQLPTIKQQELLADFINKAFVALHEHEILKLRLSE